MPVNKDPIPKVDVPVDGEGREVSEVILAPVSPASDRRWPFSRRPCQLKRKITTRRQRTFSQQQILYRWLLPWNTERPGTVVENNFANNCQLLYTDTVPCDRI